MASAAYDNSKKNFVNNADYGITLQCILCKRNSLQVGNTALEHFHANYNEEFEDELAPICEKIESLLPYKLKEYTTYTDKYTSQKQTTSPHNFILKNGSTLSIRTTKTGDKVAPRTLGQAGAEVLNDFFSEILGREIQTQEDVKNLMYNHIHEVLPYFIDYLFKSDYTIFVNRKESTNITLIKADEVGEISFERGDFTFTRDLSDWTESTTLKYQGTSIAEIQVHSKRFFKFRFHILKIPSWLINIKETTETLGMTTESAICKVFNLERPSSFVTRVSPSIEKKLIPVIKDAFKYMPKAILHTGSTVGERGESSKCSYDFVLEGNKTLSVKSNKGKMVCPPEVGQPGSDTCLYYFKKFLPDGITEVSNKDFKEMVYHHIEKIMPIYLSHLMDSDWLLWVFREKEEFLYKVIDCKKVCSFKWDRNLFSYTKESIDKWNESNTVKYNGITIGEFQVHSNRVCFKFRFQMKNLLTLLNI